MLKVRIAGMIHGHIEMCPCIFSFCLQSVRYYFKNVLYPGTVCPFDTCKEYHHCFVYLEDQYNLITTADERLDVSASVAFEVSKALFQVASVE